MTDLLPLAVSALLAIVLFVAAVTAVERVRDRRRARTAETPPERPSVAHAATYVPTSEPSRFRDLRVGHVIRVDVWPHPILVTRPPSPFATGGNVWTLSGIVLDPRPPAQPGTVTIGHVTSTDPDEDITVLEPALPEGATL